MRSIEEKIDIPSAQGRLPPRDHELHRRARRRGQDVRLQDERAAAPALELKLFEDQKDSIKLTSLVSTVVDKDTQEKIDVVKGA
jgi:serine protein kinase